MRLVELLSMAIITIVVAVSCTTTIEREREPLTQLSFEKVTLEDEFWLPRLKKQKEVLVPFSLDKTRFSVDNLRRVGQYLRGERVTEPFEGAIFVASDLFKVMEGAAYLLTLEPDPELEAQMDELIDIIAEAQDHDGYYYEHHILPKHLRNKDNTWAGGEARYAFVDHSHELYNMGHMYEGAVAYFRATGKRKWLDVAEKSAQHVNRVFFEGDPNYNGGKPKMQAPGHEEIELALVKLAQATGNDLYLEMARKFIDIRGVTYRPDGTGAMTPTYAQQQAPVREQRTAEGHAVRAMYLYSGMADVMAATGDTSLAPALDSIWHDVMDKKIHINGGLGSVPGIEGFGPAYMLPNKDTYDETCAAVGNVFFNYRMFLASGDAKYVDAAEISLYNNVLAGMNLEGNKFFYVNLLESDGKRAFNHGHVGRSPWFGCACCPSNMARLIPQVSGMAYSHTDDDIYCALYVGSSVEVPLAAGAVKLKQQTEYPFDGKVSIEVNPAVDGEEFTLWLRIPTWVGDRFIPGNLYSYADDNAGKAEAYINGDKVSVNVSDGYLPVCRQWHTGDKVELVLPMPVRYSVADERVEADRNRVCITRGPLVYCAEQPDNEYGASTYIVNNIGEQGDVASFADGVLEGIDYITIASESVNLADETTISATLTLIPYYAWNNRGDGTTMNVWFARDKQTAIDGMRPTVGNIIDVKASYTCLSDTEYAIADGKTPSNSKDTTIPRWTSWKELGKRQTLEVILKEKQPIECVSVYWFEDKAGIYAPVSWSMEYKDGNEWKPFQHYITDRFGVEIDQFNDVHPQNEIVTDALRITMTPRPDKALGVLEVIVK